MWHTSTVSSTATVTFIILCLYSCGQLTYPAEHLVCSVLCMFHYSTKANYTLDNVHSAAALWGKIECSTVHNVLLCAMYVFIIQRRQLQTCD